MSGASSGRAPSSRLREPPPPELRLVNWPLRDEGLGAWLLAALCIGIGAGVGLQVESLPTGLLAFAALALSVWRLWIPVTFEFDRHGMVETVLGRRRRIDWTKIGGYQVYRRGVKLYAVAEPERLAALRGLYIRWNGRRDQLLALLEFYRGRPVRL